MTASHTDIWHTLIVGAGASGLMCAGSFAAPKLVLEHNPGPGRKLNVTGGGKCNFTHSSVSAADYVSGSKHFCKNALAAFRPEQFTALLDSAHIPYTQTPSGQFFAQDARAITHLLVTRAKENNTSFSFSTQVLDIRPENGLFRVHTSRGTFHAMNIVLACGGLSYPSLGATSFAWQIARPLGLTAVAPRPALVGLSLPSPWKERCRALAGNTLRAKLQTGKHIEEGPLLFTHDGVSGPAVLQSSLYWREGETIRLNFLPDIDAETFLRTHKNENASFSKILTSFIAPKISKTLLAELDAHAADASNKTLRLAGDILNRLTCVPRGTAGYAKAEVTAGGVDCTAFNPSTMECKKLPGFFVIGEALDVTGRVGGYNLHWAWASAWAATRALAAR